MRCRPRFPLSSLFLITLAVAIALGWYVDSRRRQSIVGTWVFPTPEYQVTGYFSSLEVRADGTFEKSESGRDTTDIFVGTYEFDKEGRLIFHVASKASSTSVDELLHTAPKKTKLNSTCHLRCAVDPAGYLLLQDLSMEWPDEKSGIHWESYMGRGSGSGAEQQK